MPFALHVLTEQRLAVVVERAAYWVVFHPDVVEALRPRLEGNPRDGAVGIEQTRGVPPEQARLKRIAIAADGHGLGHGSVLTRRRRP